MMVGDVIDDVESVGEVEHREATGSTQEGETWEATKRVLFALDIEGVPYGWAVSTALRLTKLEVWVCRRVGGCDQKRVDDDEGEEEERGGRIHWGIDDFEREEGEGIRRRMG